jgi:hypothetical protein
METPAAQKTLHAVLQSIFNSEWTFLDLGP